MLDRYDYGILGVGEIGAAIVTGLCADVDDAPRILLSPRNAAKSAALAARYVRSIFANVAGELGDSRENLDGLARAHATPGGINERFSAMLHSAGVFDSVSRSLQVIYDQLQVRRS